ncbi:hypothetical protein OIDMADRAFT_184602 [Oidiodendron maius Zn]|uniref:Xylanolytic transcriptional activator regulatory domain-containing protein n=1 Tax=Oidiodendron maius (strain Zn) TaxID=913774 RepID=A0A0C3GRC5_OIDMZ|nr:hypothetical protein OIDMADRAFT_184602 [Oidiodendron maius Zn]
MARRDGIQGAPSSTEIYTVPAAMSAVLSNLEKEALPSQSKGSICFLLNWVKTDTNLTETFGYSAISDIGCGSVLLPNSSFFKDALEYPCAEYSIDSPAEDMPLIYQSTPLDHSDEFDWIQAAMSADNSSARLPICGADRSQPQNLSDGLMESHPWFDESTFARPTLATCITNGLVSHLTEICLSIPEYHPGGAKQTRLSASMALLTPSDIERYIGLYFHHWNRHSPLIHPGTFDAAKVALPLLLAVILTGALFASHDEATMARNMLDIAEEFAFRDSNFVELVSGVVPLTPDSTQFETIQAAFSMAQLQLREGSSSKRKHARIVRFREIIQATRTLSLTSTRKTTFQEQADLQHEWIKFSQDEAKIRFICGLFGLDAAFTIFYNMPPRLFADELNIDMPCSVDSYAGQTASDCYQAVVAETIPAAKMAEIVTIFLEDQWDAKAHRAVEGLTVLHLFTIILALLQNIWISRYKQQRTKEIVIESVRRALVRWKTEWDFCVSGMTAEQLEQAGFMKDAAIAFWHLGTSIVGKGTLSITTGSSYIVEDIFCHYC